MDDGNHHLNNALDGLIKQANVPLKVEQIGKQFGYRYSGINHAVNSVKLEIIFV